jgi:two-component system nitrogen regulation response regulator NtrX
MAPPLILIVDDEKGIRESLADVLGDEGYRTHAVDSGEAAVRAVEGEPPDLVLLDIWLPGMDGLDTLGKIKEMRPEIPVVMISGHGTIEVAVRATKIGAFDFLEKPLSLDRVILSVQRALAMHDLSVENRALREAIAKRWTLIGESGPMKALRRDIEMAARSNSRVLITGESGTGKEVVAHMLHELGPRAGKPFIEVNCAAMPQELIESELFGHEKGSFTGAFEMKRGKFELADGGTLFLDEIADMSYQTQAKLLRVLESQSFQRVGGQKSLTVDVRVIAATNKDIEALAREEKFRSDLYYRLNVIPLGVPALRARREDVPLLCDHFLRAVANEYGQAPKRLTDEAVAALVGHGWPGNVRELKNLIERLVIMTPGETIGTEGLRLGERSADDDLFSYRTLREARDAYEREFIERKLREFGWNVSRTAEALEIERSNLHRKIKAYEIKEP